MEIHHFALSQTLAQTNGFLVLFSSSTPDSQVAHPFYQKERNSSIFSIPEPESALLGPECDFRVPCVKPFINVRFWEVFWRPGTGKEHFLRKKCEIPPRNRISSKKRFWARKCPFSRKGGKSHETLPFLL